MSGPRLLEELQAFVDSIGREPGWAPLFRTFAIVGLATGLGASLGVLLVGWNQPIIDMHGFRQTQTALTVYWLLRGGNWLAYETPVLGAPWSIPMEFPLYQWIVAVVTWGVPIGLDQVGRIVSYLFFVLCLWPLRIVLREIGLGWETWLVTSALLLMAPIYLFWSRTFMIESTALFLALCFLGCYLRWLNTGSNPVAITTLLFLTLALLVKVTTAIPFGILAFMLSISPAVAWLRARDGRLFMSRTLVAVFVAASGLIAISGWVRFTDAIKAENPFGVNLTSAELSQWNFGSLAQRVGPELWVETVAGRAAPEALGATGMLFLLLLLALLMGTRVALLALTFVIAWLSAFLLFTNLHVVHNYYQYSNAMMLILAAGIIVGELARQRPVLAVVVFVAMLTLQWLEFAGDYGRLITRDFSNTMTLRVAERVRQETSPGSAILVAMHDWSPVVAYYSERKSLTLPRWSEQGALDALALAPTAFVAPLSISAVVSCRSVSRPGVQQAVDRALLQLQVRHVEAVGGCEIALVN